MGYKGTTYEVSEMKRLSDLFEYVRIKEKLPSAKNLQ